MLGNVIRKVCHDTILTAADINTSIYVDGPRHILLPRPIDAGPGHILFKKIDIAADAVWLLPPAGLFEFGRKVHWLPTEGDAVLMQSDGIATDGSGWKIALAGGMSAMRMNEFRGEHTVTTDVNSVHPWDNGFLYIIDPYQAPSKNVYLGLPNIPDVAFGHQQFHVTFLRLDSGPGAGVVSLVSAAAPQGFAWYPNRIGDAGGGVQKIDMTASYQTITLETGGNVWLVPRWNGWGF